MNSSRIVNPSSGDVLYDNTNNSTWYPHLKVDMSRCDYYNDGSGVPVALVGHFNYNFAFQTIDEFIWPKNNKEWTYLGDDMFEDGQIKCDMNLTGLKNLTTIGHWGCGRWQMPDNDLYLPGTINNLTWESFNGSRIRDLYFPINNTITWQTFTDDDLDAFKKEIEDTVDNIINLFVPPVIQPLFDGFVDAIISAFEDEIEQGTEGNDVFIFGNTEINHIFTNNLGVGFFEEHVGKLFEEKNHSHNYPDIFWTVGMADCPEKKYVQQITIK
ncbi:MAG: hypothetical protein LBG49_00215 [Mycoplasmataceae bacterium]|nr:hypothetical protein [Mycoplasmataceae bacterium]